MADIPATVKKFLSEIGRKGGRISKRVLTHEQSMKMIEAREAKRKKRREKAKERKKGK